VALDVLDRSTVLLAWHLFWGARPFCELMRQRVAISKKQLRKDLAEMERRGLVRRQVGAGDTPVYGLTALGESLKPFLTELYEWGLRNAFLALPPSRPARAPVVPALRPPRSPALSLRIRAPSSEDDQGNQATSIHDV